MTAAELRDSMDELEYHAKVLRERGHEAEAERIDNLFRLQGQRLEAEVAAALIEIELATMVDEGISWD